MSNIKISGVSQTKFFNMTKEALSLSLGSNITRTEVVDKFLMNLFRHKNKHLLSTVFDKQKNVLIEDESISEEKPTFVINEKRAVFEYHLDGTLKLVQIHVGYSVVGFWDQRKVSISEGIIDPDTGYVIDIFPSYTDYKSGRDSSSATNQEAAVNLHTANSHAFELSTWINTVKQSLSPSDLKADGWKIQIFGCGLSCADDPTIAIDGLKYRAKPDSHAERTEIELILLQLAGVDIDSGYYHDDVIYTIKKMRPIFGNKFDVLMTCE